MHLGYFYALLPELFLRDAHHDFLSPESIEKRFEEKMAAQKKGIENQGAADYTAILDIRGPILKYSKGCWVGTQALGRWVEKLDRDSSVNGIVLNIDSGGGMISGTSQFSEIIRNCQTPTASFTHGYMCSAAQQIGAACNFSVAHPHADLLGSVGTLLYHQDFSKMFEKWGAAIYEVYAPQSSEKNKAFRALEQGDTKEMEGQLDQYASEFIDTMKQYRGTRLKEDGDWCKGKAYRPKEAKQIGLIDEIQSLEWVVNQF